MCVIRDQLAVVCRSTCIRSNPITSRVAGSIRSDGFLISSANYSVLALTLACCKPVCFCLCVCVCVCVRACVCVCVCCAHARGCWVGRSSVGRWMMMMMMMMMMTTYFFLQVFRSAPPGCSSTQKALCVLCLR